MTPTLLTLKLTLDILHIPIFHRFAAQAQAAIYLAQTFGNTLDAYHFKTSLNAPYSARLANDFEELCGSLEAGDRTHYETVLIQSVRRRLTALRRHLEAPITCSLDRADWLVLLAQLQYLTSDQWIHGHDPLIRKGDKVHQTEHIRQAEKALAILSKRKHTNSGYVTHHIPRNRHNRYVTSPTSPL